MRTGGSRVRLPQAREAYREEYARSHNGAFPPESACEKLSKIFCRQKVYSRPS